MAPGVELRALLPRGGAGEAVAAGTVSDAEAAFESVRK